MDFGGHRGRTYEDVFDNERSYINWLLGDTPSGKAGVFAAYCKDRRAAEGLRMNYGQEEAVPADPRNRALDAIIHGVEEGGGRVEDVGNSSFTPFCVN